MRAAALFIALALTVTAGAATRNNDDSCDIAVLPAATLLLPYFEVDVHDALGPSTVFSITNTGNLDRIAHVTLWTDRAYPVLGFDIYLTGYDVQAIDLYDVLARGVIAPDKGTGTAITRRRQYADANPDLDYSHCGFLAGVMDDVLVERVRRTFTEGTVDGCGSVGGVHEHAIGYATIDVVGTCGSAGVTDETYWMKDLRYDNVLTGDYAQVDVQHTLGQSEPLVHIRAIPEGGSAMRRRAFPEQYDAGFERTFYGRYQPNDAPMLDGRQPLPSQFAARWIHGGSGAFETHLKVWREGRDDGTCAGVARNTDLTINDIVVFDENENVLGTTDASKLPATSSISIADASVFPPLPEGATSGWVYVDLDGRTSQLARPRQSWVISSMRAEDRYSTDTTAVTMGNGCSVRLRDAEIGPAPNVSPRQGVAATNNDDSCDVGLYPAATLLLPYFSVDLDHRHETTLFSITNVTSSRRIARVTLWTDYAFPVVSFNIALGGYDVQSINLFDVIAAGRIANDGGGCPGQVRQLDEAIIVRMQSAFVEGVVPDLGPHAGCDNVGNEHDFAVGYATIDVVRNCSDNIPTTPEYWTEDLAYDNVLTGDSQQVSPFEGFAHGSPLVHIRAVPEGGTSAQHVDAGFARTFYGRFQAAATPKLDGRQPLPARFAVPWRIESFGERIATFLNIWREPLRGNDASCTTYDDNVMEMPDVVAFDDAENAFGVVPCSRCVPPSYTTTALLPATSSTSPLDSDIFPQPTNGAVSGWLYLNLDNRGTPARASSNWVVVTTFEEGRSAVSFDAAGLGNGCSPPADISEVTYGPTVINPSENVNP